MRPSASTRSALPGAISAALQRSIRRLLDSRFRLARATLRRQAVGAAREQLLGGDRSGDDALLERVADQLVDHLAVGRDAVGQGIAGDLHHAPMHLVGLARLLDLAGLEPL